ncbi:hypothetical protein CR51_18750 [Caballeronia megalochromosomata]|nr:hypothetical protein CR51_18750 [Caballeronia megalochromosomata]
MGGHDTGFARHYLGDTGLWVVLSAPAGALGALLSVILRTGKLKVDGTAGERLHRYEAASRIVAGAISGVIVSLAVLSGLILSSVAHGLDIHKIAILVALVAGSGERLVSSIISKMEEGGTNTKSRQKKEVRRATSTERNA